MPSQSRRPSTTPKALPQEFKTRWFLPRTVLWWRHSDRTKAVHYSCRNIHFWRKPSTHNAPHDKATSRIPSTISRFCTSSNRLGHCASVISTIKHTIPRPSCNVRNQHTHITVKNYSSKNSLQKNRRALQVNLSRT